MISTHINAITPWSPCCSVNDMQCRAENADQRAGGARYNREAIFFLSGGSAKKLFKCIVLVQH